MGSLGNGALDSHMNKKRCSPMLKQVPEGKRPYYGPSPRKPEPAVSYDLQFFTTPTVVSKVDGKDSELNNVRAEAASTGQKLLNLVYVAHTRKDKSRVKKALRIYNKYYLHFFQEQNECESGSRRLAKHLDSKKEGVCEKRPDLKAISKMIECNEVLFPTKRFGHLPGIDVGYQFYSRAEMVALGLHSHCLNDIDYMGPSYCILEEFKGYPFPIAVAIVLSGQYEDDEDNSEDIVYTSQGGKDFRGSKHQLKNQEISDGNLALKNSMEQCIPVRVIRGQ